MTPSQVLLLAFLIGVVAGLRSLTAPAVVAWAAHRNWLNLHTSLSPSWRRLPPSLYSLCWRSPNW